MQQTYLPRDIERSTQQYWEAQQTFRAAEQSDKPKYYCLSMFPYPSALYLSKQDRYTTLQAQAMRERGLHASRAQMVLSPVLRFVKFYLLRLGFLDGVAGLKHILIGCRNSYTKYAKLRAYEKDAKS